MSLDDNLQLFQQSLGYDLTLVQPGRESDLPPLWKGYLGGSTARDRLDILHVELGDMADYLPETAQRLILIANDAFLVEHPQFGICRVIAVTQDSNTWFRYSRCPLSYAAATGNRVVDLIAHRAPAALKYLYFNMMDGLTDPYGFAGFKNSLALTTVEDEIDTYAELPFYDRVEALGDGGNVVELFASGGAGYLLIDLNQDRRDDSDPHGFQMSNYASHAWSPDRPVPLFGTLDAWMAVGMGQTGPSQG
ncbi:MAG: hypothetical protein ACO1O4_01240 [Devosia sp.]